MKALIARRALLTVHWLAVAGCSSSSVGVGPSGVLDGGSSEGSAKEPDATAPDARAGRGDAASPDASATDAVATPDSRGVAGDGASGGDAESEPVGGVPGGKVGVGTKLAGCVIFPSDNPWNVEVDGPAVQVIHTYDSELPQGTEIHPDLGGYTTDTGGIPWNTVDAGQPDLPTQFTSYANESDPGPSGWVGANPVTTGAAMGTTAYPFFVGMKVEGNPPPGGTAGNLPGDQHGLVLEQGSTPGCTSYEAWNCVVVGSPPFKCANGAVFDLSSNASRPLGFTSADAAGLSILAGLVKLSEVKAGLVTHAMRATFATTQSGYISPATHAAGSKPLGSAYPPMGLRLRLKASVSTSAYTTASQVIMAALKKYGLIVADNGSDWFFGGDSDDRWTTTAPDGMDTLANEVVGDFRHLSGADFEVVYTGEPIATGL